MQNSKLKLLILLIFSFICVLNIRKVKSQSVYVNENKNIGGAIEWLKYSSSDSQNPLTTTLFINAKGRISSAFYWIGEIPISHKSGSYTEFGNIYVGTEILLGDTYYLGKNFHRLEIGINTPTKSKEFREDSPGRLTTIERYGVFVDNIIRVHSYYNVFTNLNKYVNLRLRSGFSYKIFEDWRFPNTNYSKNSAFFHYGGKLGLNYSKFSLNLFYFSRNNIYAQDPTRYLPNTRSEVGAHLKYTHNSFSMGFLVKYPLQENTFRVTEVNSIYGLTIELPY